MDFQVVVLLGFGEHCYQLVWTKNGSCECLSNRWSTLFLKLEFKNVFSSKTKITPYVMQICIFVFLYFCILYFCILYFCIFVFLYFVFLLSPWLHVMYSHRKQSDQPIRMRIYFVLQFVVVVVVVVVFVAKLITTF